MKMILFALVVMSSSSLSYAVELTNPLTVAISNCIKADLAQKSNPGPNVANHGNSKEETETQDPHKIKPVLQTECSGEVATVLYSVASQFLKFIDLPYASCEALDQCPAIVRQFKSTPVDGPGDAYCITRKSDNKIFCLFNPIYPVEFKRDLRS